MAELSDKIFYNHIMAAYGWLYPDDGRDPSPVCARPHIGTIITELEARLGLSEVIAAAAATEYEEEDE